MFPLNDEQIATRRPPAADNGPILATQMRGGTCMSASECEKAGGIWKQDMIGWYCDGADCKDSGTGDWD